MAHPLLAKVAGLPQITATWHVTVRRAPAWITPKNKPPYRPFLTLILDANTDRIRGSKTEENRPTVEIVLNALANAMANPVPGGGKRGRPTRILLDDAGLVQELQPRLAEIGVRCEYHAASSLVTNALREMDATMNRRPPQPGLLSVKGVTLPLVAELFQAAADFHVEAPWRWLDNLAPLELHYPAEGPARYAVIMGSGGEEFGLALYQSLDDLRFQYQTQDPKQLFKKISSLSLTFGEPMLLSFEDLDAIEEHDWPVADPRAYPLVMKVVPPGKFVSPNAAEVALLAAVLRALPGFVTEALRADRGVPAAAEATYPLPNVHGKDQIRLCFPVDLIEIWSPGHGKVDEKELQDLIKDWYHDERSHVFARQIGAFLLPFMDYLATTERSEKALTTAEGNCWTIGKLTCDFGGFETFTPAIFLGGPKYQAEFRQKISQSPDALASYRATWRKLESYVRKMGY
jgi:hypothetical protein